MQHVRFGDPAVICCVVFQPHRVKRSPINPILAAAITWKVSSAWGHAMSFDTVSSLRSTIRLLLHCRSDLSALCWNQGAVWGLVWPDCTVQSNRLLLWWESTKSAFSLRGLTADVKLRACCVRSELPEHSPPKVKKKFGEACLLTPPTQSCNFENAVYADFFLLLVLLFMVLLFSILMGSKVQFVKYGLKLCLNVCPKCEGTAVLTLRHTVFHRSKFSLKSRC